MGKASRARRSRAAVPPVAPATTPVDVLDQLRHAAADLAQLQDQVHALIRAARAAGYSWDQISPAAGINRETLRRNFGSPHA